jgi:molecular chaperone DnaK
MSEMINFGIDLGTTNSLVAKFNKGAVEVFKNPNGFKETLPSVVGFRADRILVGDQARRYVEKDSKNVVSRFKRRMGTTESFRIPSLGQSKTPIELSALVLKELKTFIHTGETPEAAVITIPASFDMVQSNATTEAGHAAGFRQVVLLQEPIAASLAYANKERNLDLKNSQWIVYDLGGGTFDVALVKIVEGELKVVDHEGDNHLGGMDFDALIVEKLVVPQLEKRGRFTDLLRQMTSATGRYNTLWYSLLHRAEEAKIELSSRSSSEIDLSRSSVVDESGKEIEDCLPITRTEYEALIKDEIDRTAAMLKTILTRNSLRPRDLQFVLMVGGSTYTPLVRKRIEELLGIPVNTGIDPTSAIAIGAAYYAGTKEMVRNERSAQPMQPGALRVRVSYNRASQEREELFSAKVEGDVAGLFYRIRREDGGYDSGLKALAPRISEDLPLEADAYNLFAFTVYDGRNNPVPTDVDSIQIAQGIVSVAGQPLPEDLSLVVDDPNNILAKENAYDTTLKCIFARHCVLPARAKRTVEVSKTVLHGSSDEIKIIVVEGPSQNHFTVNKTVGYLTISGKQLKRDRLRGMEIDLSFELSESRELTVQAYVNPSGPEFLQIFTPTKRDVRVEHLAEEVQMLDARLEQEQAEAIEIENYVVADKLKRLHAPVKDLCSEAMLLPVNDSTDDRYKLEARKRKLAQEINQLTLGKRLERLRAEYREVKDDVTGLVNESGNDHERRELKEVVALEHTFLDSSAPRKLEEAIQQLRRLSYRILRRTPDFLVRWFEHLVGKRELFNDQLQAKNLIEAGNRHIVVHDYDKLAEVNERLLSLLPQREQDDKEMSYFTRIIIS